MKKVLLFLIKSYQKLKKLLFPLKTGSCVFLPTCSEYALEAVEKHGPFKGSYLAIKRILRCHPWQKQHYDPVP